MDEHVLAIDDWHKVALRQACCRDSRQPTRMMPSERANVVAAAFGFLQKGSADEPSGARKEDPQQNPPASRDARPIRWLPLATGRNL